MITQLFTGIFIGSLLASIAWFFILKANKTKLENEQKTRDELMHSLGELWVEVDSLLSSFRSGMLDERSFRDTFASKIEAINHVLKPNLHLFDVYYVKYIETLIKEYNRKAHLKDPNDMVSASEFSSDMETNYTPVAPPEQTDLFKSQIEEIPPPAPVQETTAQPEEEIDFSQQLLESNTEKATPATQSPFEVTLAPAVHDHNVDTHTTVSPITPEAVSDEVDAMFEDAFASFDTSTPKDAEEIKRTAEVAEATFENTPPPKTTAPIEVSVNAPLLDDDEVSDETIIGFDKAEFHKKINPPPSGQPHFAKREDEDFSTETLMDVDVHSISHHIKGMPAKSQTPDDDIDKTRYFENLPDTPNRMVTDKTELDVDLASEAAGVDTKEPRFPEETTYTRSDEMSRRTSAASSTDDEEFEVIIPEKREEPTQPFHNMAVFSEPTNQTVSPADEYEGNITGDDIVDKISALESSSPVQASEKRPQQEPPKKSIPAGVKGPIVGDLKPTQKQPVTNELKSPASGETPISGDDVSDQIDSFFGLFK